jgi:IS5 family transposase
MKQAALNLNLQLKKTRKQVFLEQMEQLVSWTNLISLIAPYYPEGNSARPPFPLMTMLRTHFMQQWLTLSDPAMEESFFDTPVYRDFAQFEEFARLPDESTIPQFRHRLEEHKLADQILITVNDLLTAKGLLPKADTASDATLIAAPTSTKNKDRTRDPEMCSSKKGNQWYLCRKAYIGADAESGLVHTVRGTSGHVNDIAEGNTLLRGEETVAFGEAGYQGIERRAGVTPDVLWHVAMRPGKRKALDKDNQADATIVKAEKLKASVLAKLEPPFWVIKRQFGFVKVRGKLMAAQR